MTITLWIDDAPRDGPTHMALDEALLLTTSAPVLRVYRWAGPWVSLGCFVPRAEVERAFPGRPTVRRWTGGGIVDHAADWTYSLVVPRGEPLAALGPADSYRVIHAALVSALAASGVPARLADAPPPGLGGLCFQRPVRADVVVEDGRKIAGAAQRRTRHGLLHQGSVQAGEVPVHLPTLFALALGVGQPSPMATPPASLTELAHTIAREKYATPTWLNRR